MIITDCYNRKLYEPIQRIFGLEESEFRIIESVAEGAWNRCLYCFEKVNNPRFHTGGIQLYHTVQYSMFLYFLANEIYQKEIRQDSNPIARDIADKIFATNTALSGVDIYYEQKLPDIFLMAHTVGTVFTPKTTIGDYFMFMQGCNIGISNGHAPKLGQGVVMWGNSKIIGKCNIGNHVMLGANTYIKDMDIPDDSIVFGQYPNVIIKENRGDQVLECLHERFVF